MSMPEHACVSKCENMEHVSCDLLFFWQEWGKGEERATLRQLLPSCVLTCCSLCLSDVGGGFILVQLGCRRVVRTPRLGWAVCLRFLWRHTVYTELAFNQAQI